MKTAIVICGNLRTFLMPTSDGHRLCDDFVDNVVKPNNADVFAFTDTSDFYFNDTQYFATNRRVEVLNNDTSRLHSKIDFLSEDDALTLIHQQLGELGFKDVYVSCTHDLKNIDKYKELAAAKIDGNNPELLLQQLHKMQHGYGMLLQHEHENNFKYDVIIKWRFDNTVNGPLDIQSYNFNNADIYVPGIHSPVIYDWFAFGKRAAMDSYLSLYDYAGSFLNEGRVFLCSRCSYSGNKNHMCYSDNEMYEISLSVEYHIYKLCKMKNIRLANASYSSCPRRYNNANRRVEDVMKNVDATLVTYKPGVDIIETSYRNKNE